MTNTRANRIIATPRARRALRLQGVDPRTLTGSGPGGRIVEADVARAGPALSPMRRAIARRTAESFATVPHFYLRAELDATALLARRQELLEQITGARVTVTDLLVQAVARALRDCPFANCIWQNETIVKLPTNDVGVVVGLDDGLLIPIIRNADNLDVAALTKQRAELVAAARAGRLPGEATAGGATSISNLGTSRVDEFQAVIAAPQSSMLAVGRIAERPFVVAGQLAVRPTLRLCLSVDHRVLDGGPAAEFLGRIVETLEGNL